MNDVSRVAAEEMVSLRAGAALLGVGEAALRKRVTDGVIPAFRDALDTRAIKLRRSDLERLRDERLKPLVIERASA